VRQQQPIMLGAGLALLILVLLGGVWLARPASPQLSESVAAEAQAGTGQAGLSSPETQASPAAPAAGSPQPATAVANAQPTVPSPRPQPFAPLLYDDFSQITSGWTPLFVGAQGTVNGYSAEGFAFSTATPGQLLYNLFPSLSFTPTRYQVELSPLEGAGLFGLMLDVRGNIGDYSSLAFYGVGLNTGGDLLLLVKADATELQVIPLAKAVAPPLAPGGTTRLSADWHGENLTVFVDGAEALSVAVPPQQGGTVGFFARSEDRLTVRFDNLLLTAGAPEPQPSCTQIRPLFTGAVSGEETIAGEDVLLVQRRLARLGYASGPEGPYSAQTAAAVAQFQARNDLPADGIVGSQTWCSLLSADAILFGSDQSEHAMLRERYHAVAILPEAELPAPLLVSVREAERQWQIALALPGRTNLYVIDTGGDALDPAWLPEEGLLAFSSVRGADGVEAVWILDTHSGRVRQISPPLLQSKYPAWSPDGRALMFTAELIEGQDKQARNYVYTLDDGLVTPWGGTPAGWSDWSPVGTVVFTRWTGRSFDIFAAERDGSNEVNLTNTDDFHEDIPAWSPSGDRIAYVRNPKGAPDDRQLYLMQADGSEAQPITSLPGPNSNPIWLDATTLVFAHQPSEEVRQPYLLRLPGDVRRLSASEERVWFMQRFGLPQ